MNAAADRAGRFAAVVLLLLGYLAIFRPAEAAIAERYRALDAARATLDARLALARRAGPLRAQRERLQAQLAAIGLYDRRPAALERFLRALATTAARDGVRVTAIAAENARSAAGPAPAFDELPLSVSVRGTYANVLRCFADLDRAAFAARIGIRSIAGDEARGPAPELRATLDVTLLRLPAGTAARADGAG